MLLLLSGVLGSLASCAAPPSDPNVYDLECEFLQVGPTAALVCARIHTITGDVQRIAVEKLKTLEGSTREPPLGPNAYELICKATPSGGNAASAYCVRLNRRSGQVVVLSLPTLPVTEAP